MTAPEENYKWVEITDDFMKSTESLKLGELLHDKMFGLYEAMSAIEMMDPKMDAGMLCNRGCKKVMNFDTALKAEKLKIQDLTIEEQIGIVDATLACLVTWLEGHSLAQTVFTNLYLHNPLRVEDRLIKAFSICILKIVETVREIVNKSSVFEEEDFQPAKFGHILASDTTDVRAVGMMKEIEEEMQRKVKSTRNKNGEQQDPNIQFQHEGAVALFSRIKFCRLFYYSLLLFNKKKAVTNEEILTHLQHCAEFIPAMQRTVNLGIQPNLTAGSNNRDYPTILGFEPLVNQRLLPPTFPRYTKIKTRKEAMEYLEQLVLRLKHICRINECSDFHTALDFFTEFSKTSPCVLSRSVLHMLYTYVPADKMNRMLGNQPMTEVIRDCIRNFIRPPALLPRSTLLNNPQARDFVETFLIHCMQPFSYLLQICGHNRARQRDKMARLLEDFPSLQEEADKVDGLLHNLSTKSDNQVPHLACFGTWVLYHTVKIMIQYVLSGFELDLYSTHEYPYIFWYLYEFLYGWMVSALSRADNFVMQHTMRLELQQQKNRNAKKNRKKKKLRQHEREIQLNQALQHLCGGYYKVVAGLNLEGKLKRPHLEFDNEQVRYEHRFTPFNNIMTPPPVQYAHYCDMTDLNRYPIKPTAEDLYMSACKCFQHARLLLENIPEPSEEISLITKVAKTNFVVVKLLHSGHKDRSKDLPTFDFTMHKIFPVIKIM